MAWWRRDKDRRRDGGPADQVARRIGGDRDRVRAAFAKVPREPFLPEAVRARAAFNGPLQIGHGQTNSQPQTVEAMLLLLDVRPGHRVLDVGSGSGWTTALLAALAGPDGRVLGLEIVAELAEWGAANLEGFLSTGSEGDTALAPARIERADTDVLGRPEDGPFDRILVSAMASRLPQALVDQLAENGRLVCPVKGEMLLVEVDDGEPRISGHGGYRFVPLQSPKE